MFARVSRSLDFGSWFFVGLACGIVLCRELTNLRWRRGLKRVYDQASNFKHLED